MPTECPPRTLDCTKCCLIHSVNSNTDPSSPCSLGAGPTTPRGPHPSPSSSPASFSASPASFFLLLPGGHDVGRATRAGRKFLGFGVSMLSFVFCFSGVRCGVVSLARRTVSEVGARFSYLWSRRCLSSTPSPPRVLQNILFENSRCPCGGVEYPLLLLGLYIYYGVLSTPPISQARRQIMKKVESSPFCIFEASTGFPKNFWPGEGRNNYVPFCVVDQQGPAGRQSHGGLWEDGPQSAS